MKSWFCVDEPSFSSSEKDSKCAYRRDCPPLCFKAPPPFVDQKQTCALLLR
jgi:hypothetical protein